MMLNIHIVNAFNDSPYYRQHLQSNVSTTYVLRHDEEVRSMPFLVQLAEYQMAVQ